MSLYRYSRWDGSQQVFTIDHEDIMEELADHIFLQGDVGSALRRLASTKSVNVRALNSIEQWRASDHCRLLIEVAGE